jgi:uncharacterized protein YqhQ
MAKRFYYGGQAVIDGVMMRGHQAVVTAVRRPGGGLALDVQPLSPIYSGWMRQTPLLRGIIVLIEAMYLGIKSLLYSANVSLEEEEEQISGWLVWVIVIVSVALAVVLFSVLPFFLTGLFLEPSLPFYLVEGILRVGIFILYIGLVSFVPGIRQTFAYHGAEHKAVNAYEDGAPLEVAAVRKYDTAHRRCGTSFLFIVLVIAILVFSIIGALPWWQMLLSRIILIPVIAALGYEAIYFSANHTGNAIIRTLSTPGLWLQSLTTRPPDDGQLEVAISALNKVVEVDQREEARSLADCPGPPLSE